LRAVDIFDSPYFLPLLHEYANGLNLNWMRGRHENCFLYSFIQGKLFIEEIDYFACLYDRYEPKLLRYIKKISQADADEASDILQEAFIKMWKNLNNYDDSLKLSSWLYRIVHNETISFCRKKDPLEKII